MVAADRDGMLGGLGTEEPVGILRRMRAFRLDLVELLLESAGERRESLLQRGGLALLLQKCHAAGDGIANSADRLARLLEAMSAQVITQLFLQLDCTVLLLHDLIELLGNLFLVQLPRALEQHL